MGKIKLLFVIDHLGGGGAEAQLVELLNSLDLDKFDLNLFLTEGIGTRIKTLRSNIKIFGFLKERRRRTLRALILLRKTIKELKPNLIISWLEYSTFLTSLSAIGLEIKHIAGIWANLNYIYSEEVKFGSLKRLLLKFAYNRTDKLIFNSYNLVEKLKWITNKEFVVIYNPIDLEKFQEVPSKEKIRSILGFIDNCFYITFVGSLVKRKGVDLLIKAFKTIRDEKLILLIIGSGPLENSLKELAREDKRINFLGYREDAITYIKASDIFIFPTYSEGFPNVLIEALACETPIITTNVDGITEIIKDKINGLIIGSGNLEEIIQSLEYSIKNYGQMRKFAYEGKKALELFNKKRIISEFEKVFIECHREISKK